MPPPRPFVLNRMAVAAELRAGGAAWKTVAARLRCTERACIRWPKDYPEAWRRLYREATLRLLAEIGGEAMTVLRRLLRSKDEKMQRDATRLVLGPHLKALAQEPPAEPAPADDDADRLASFLRSHTDAEAQALLDELLARRARPADGAGAGGGGPPRPPLPE